eukprot:8014276-Alexandrium_andersonii.AAC.1
MCASCANTYARLRPWPQRPCRWACASETRVGRCRRARTRTPSRRSDAGSGSYTLNAFATFG